MLCIPFLVKEIDCVGTGETMANYRRLYRVEKTYFFTLVTHNRRQIFSHETTRTMLRRVAPFQRLAGGVLVLKMCGTKSLGE